MTGHIERLGVDEDLPYVTDQARGAGVTIVREEAVPDEVATPHDPGIVYLHRNVTGGVSLTNGDANHPTAQIDLGDPLRIRDDQVGEQPLPLLACEKPMGLVGGQDPQLTGPGAVSALSHRVVTVMVAEHHMGGPAAGESLRGITHPRCPLDAGQSLHGQNPIAAHDEAAVGQRREVSLLQRRRNHHPDALGDLLDATPRLHSPDHASGRPRESLAHEGGSEVRCQQEVGATRRRVLEEPAPARTPRWRNGHECLVYEVAEETYVSLRREYTYGGPYPKGPAKSTPRGRRPLCLLSSGGGTRTPDTRIMIPLL